MKTDRIGLIGLTIFLIGTVYMVIMGWGASWWTSPVFRNLTTMDQLNDTIWTTDGSLFWMWAFSVPLGSIVAGIGMLLYVQSKGSRIALFGIGVFIILIIGAFLPINEHYPPAYGVLGGVILAFFIVILWLWAKKRTTLEGPAKTAAEFQLVGYVFFIIAAWYLCQVIGALYMPAVTPGPSEHLSIPIFLVFGWLFLFLSHYWEFSPFATRS